PPRI
ncbi:SAM-dependent methyltransferase, partial [Gloeomargarita lithophora Alchichica-D10]